MSTRVFVVLVVFGSALACAGQGPSNVSPPADPVVAPAPEPTPVGSRPLLAQKEAGCGYTHRADDGQIRIVEEIGGGYAIVNVDGKDRMLNPTELSKPADPDAKGEQAAYADDLVRVEVSRGEKKARVEITVAGGTEKLATAVTLNECA